MRIHRIRLRNYRGVEACDLPLLAGGVTIIQGANEAGKSSLVEAVNMLLDERDDAASKRVKALKPVHRDAGAEVEIEAEIGPHAFTYFKRWHKRRETRLRIARPRLENLTGRDAHDRVRAILAEALDLDLWAALRVEQGSAVGQAALAAPSLLAALDRAAARTAAGEREETLFARAHAEYLVYWTETGREKKDPVEAARRRAEEARGRVAELECTLRELEAHVARHAELEREIAERKAGCAALEAAFQEAGARREKVHALEQELKTLEARAQAGRLRAESLEKERAARASLGREAAEAAREAERLAREAAAAAPDLERARSVHEGAKRSLLEGGERLRQAREAAAARRQDLELVRAREALAEARGAEEMMTAHRVTPAALAAIREAARRADLAAARLEASRASVKVEALRALEAEVGGRRVALAAGEAREEAVAGEIRVRIEGLVEMTVAAGATATALAAEDAAAREQLTSLCAAAGVPGLEAAARACEARREAEAGLARARKTLTEVLRLPAAADLAAVEARLAERLEGRPAGLPLAADAAAARELGEEAEAGLRRAEEAQGQGLAAEAGARKRLAELEAPAAERSAALAAAGKRCAEKEEELARARAGTPDDLLEERARLAREEAADLAREARRAREAFEAEDPRGAEKAVEAVRGDREAMRGRLRAAEDEFLRVSARLEQGGEAGLAEALAAAQGRESEERRDLESLLARAAAARLLYQVLSEERDGARRAYKEPFRERIEELGKSVFGESFAVELEDDLRIQSRTLDGVTVPYEDLSLGTKEQLAIIARLACALLVGDGGVPLIIDDALGHADPRRLEAMGALLAHAGERCQVIILTCMPERYRAIESARVIDLAALPALAGAEG
jgi:hypothetical protein